MNTTLVGEIRQRSGLTQDALARRAGTSRTRLSAYERGRTDPELDTLQRVAAAAGLEIDVRPAGTRRVRDRVRDVAHAVGDGDSHWAFRLVAELVEWTRRGRLPVEAFAADPGSTGDRRWDAFIAGVAEMLSTEHGLPVPPWASAPGRFLDDPWFVTTLRSLWPVVLVETPPALAARGVLCTGASLASV